MIFNIHICVSIIIMIPLAARRSPLAFNTLLTDIYYCYVQLDRLETEFIVPLEKQMSCEQEEKQVVEGETQEIVGQKRRARTCSGTSSTSSASKEMVAAGGTRRSKRVKVAVKVVPAYYVPAEEESLEAWSYASSGVVIRNNALTFAPRPLDSSISATLLRPR